MAVDIKTHKAVVVVNDVAFGFSTLHEAVSLIENQVLPDRAFNEVVAALTEGTEIEGINHQIFDIDSYIDLYEEENED